MALEQQNGRRVQGTDRQESGYCGTKLRGDETLSPITAYSRWNFAVLC
jgi:hypothetical protein